MTDPRCGSLAGYSAHRRRGEKPCDPCRLEQNAYRCRKAAEAKPPPVEMKDRALMPDEPANLNERRLAEHTPEWMLRGTCRGMDQTLWFPGRGQQQEAKQGKKICWEECLTRSECLEFAIETIQDNGIWGGMSFKERQAVRSAR